MKVRMSDEGLRRRNVQPAHSYLVYTQNTDVDIFDLTLNKSAKTLDLCWPAEARMVQ